MTLDLVAAAHTRFTEIFGHAPDGVWSAPGRVNLIGEHTDYNDGFVFPFAIDRRTVAALGVRDDRLVRVSSSFTDEVVEASLSELGPGGAPGWQNYPLGVAWALGQLGADLAAVPGFDLYLDSDVPVGAGLSSSAAIEVAVAGALTAAFGIDIERTLLARLCQRGENFHAADSSPFGR